MSYCICPYCQKKIDLFGKGRIKKLAKGENMPFLGEIPLDLGLRNMADKGNIKLNQLNPQIKKTLENITKNINGRRL